MLTKSLHTVTAVANVAGYLHQKVTDEFLTNKALLRGALAVLGYDIRSLPKDDPTVAACANRIAKLTGWKR